MKPMLAELTFVLPEDRFYEIKYDGFRGIIEWHEQEAYLWSRNGKDLLPYFPELQSFLSQYTHMAKEFLPIKLDGEIVALENPYKANFQRIQQRGKMRSKVRINKEANIWPCHFLSFDLLMFAGKEMIAHPYRKRKEKLKRFFNDLQLPLQPDPAHTKLLQYVPATRQQKDILQLMKEYDSEGIIAKLATSQWEQGKRTNAWLKFKNFKTVSCFITGMDEQNGYFYVGVWQEQAIIPLGHFLFGLDQETKAALRTIVQQNYIRKNGTILEVEPGICVDLYYLEWIAERLREPHFHKLRFDLHPDDCTFTRFLNDEAAFPKEITITHEEKPLWDHITKLDYIRYLRKVSSFILPYLQHRALTVIRSPHGIFGESFYQKNRPDSTPSFVATYEIDDINYIVCNDLKSFIWLGNQLAIEFHIPFQTIDWDFVSEIVFDLDPPNRSHFQLAVKGALILKKVLDEFHLTSFVKLSGNKGLQVYVPLQEGKFTWDDTDQFTSFIANFLVSYNPDLFTIERLKKNRGDRLYVDYVQHAKRKTIIAPYSVRLNDDALVATPINWEELTESLHPDKFTMKVVLKRMKQMKDPFAHFFSCKENQPFEQALQLINKSNEST